MGLSFSTFKNNHRNKDNFEKAYAVMVDYDAGQMSIDDAARYYRLTMNIGLILLLIGQPLTMLSADHNADKQNHRAISIHTNKASTLLQWKSVPQIQPTSSDSRPCMTYTTHSSHSSQGDTQVTKYQNNYGLPSQRIIISVYIDSVLMNGICYKMVNPDENGWPI
jgi:hypothetical protein